MWSYIYIYTYLCRSRCSNNIPNIQRQTQRSSGEQRRPHCTAGLFGDVPWGLADPFETEEREKLFLEDYLNSSWMIGFGFLAWNTLVACSSSSWTTLFVEEPSQYCNWILRRDPHLHLASLSALPCHGYSSHGLHCYIRTTTCCLWYVQAATTLRTRLCYSIKRFIIHVKNGSRKSYCQHFIRSNSSGWAHAYYPDSTSVPFFKKRYTRCICSWGMRYSSGEFLFRSLHGHPHPIHEHRNLLDGVSDQLISFMDKTLEDVAASHTKHRQALRRLRALYRVRLLWDHQENTFLQSEEWWWSIYTTMLIYQYMGGLLSPSLFVIIPHGMEWLSYERFVFTNYASRKQKKWTSRCCVDIFSHVNLRMRMHWRCKLQLRIYRLCPEHIWITVEGLSGRSTNCSSHNRCASMRSSAWNESTFKLGTVSKSAFVNVISDTLQSTST